MRRQGLIFGLETTDILLVFLVPLVAILTGRAAMNRGRNPWVWGGAALVLGIPWPGISQPILGVVPFLFLLFFVRAPGQRSQARQSACSRCASPHPPNQNYCTKCGWDLSREYSPEGSDTVLASEMHQTQGTSTATMERPPEPAMAEESETPGFPAGEPPQSSMDEGAAADSAAPAPTPDAAPADEAPETAPEPEPAQRPWGIPQPGPAPTAAVMTARGEALLSEGRLQEAIDQFTKAIALDPKHRDAFERRAEAYTQQGREERAEEDYRQVQALNAGS